MAKPLQHPKLKPKNQKLNLKKSKPQTIKPDAPKSTPKPAAKPVAKKPLSTPSAEDDVLISDDMEDQASGKSRYEFDGFLDMDMDLETKIKANSLFDRKIKIEENVIKDTSDESWADSLMDDDDDDIPQIGLIKTQASPRTINQREGRKRRKRRKRKRIGLQFY
ncbi:MAG: hypothetical protein IPK77_10085 [Cellvibrio sp.]|nr:hypothetical protein [Cellvibrio sp.]